MDKSYIRALFKYLLVVIFSINIPLPASLAQDYLRPPAAKKSIFEDEELDKDKTTTVSYPFKVMVKNVTRITIDKPFFQPREDVFIRNEKGEKVYWEKYGVMHPAAFRLEGGPHTVYLIYRAIGSDGKSRGGLAIVTLDDKGRPVEVKRFSRPIVNVRAPGSADEQGCEDFRAAIMEIEEDGIKVKKIVMGYTAVSDSSLETVLKRIKAENKVDWQKEVEEVIQYHKEHGYTGELFAQAALAVMDVSDFKNNLENWQPGENDYIWKWERYIMYEGLYDKDVIPSHVDEKGNIVIWDRPNYIIGDKTKRAMRRCITKSLKGPYIPTGVTISSQNPDHEDYPGGGSPPVRLKNGLLLMLDHRVKNNPTQLRPDHRVYSGGIIMEDGSGNILFRSRIPAIFPECWWEKNGADHWWQKSKRDGGDLDLVFPTGLILLSESWDANGVGNVKLLVFYGARDQYAGSAVMELELYDTRRPKAVTAMKQEAAQLKQELMEAKTTDEIIRAWNELGDLDAIGEEIKDILAGHIIKNSPHTGKKIDELKAVRYFDKIGLHARHKPIINMQKFISKLHLLNESNGSGRKLGKRRNGLNIEVINPVIPPADKPVLFVIDAHGTLFVPTWKQIYRMVYKEIKGKGPPAGWIEKQIIHKSRQEIIEALCKISDNYTEGHKDYLNKLIESIEADINKDVRSKARPGVLEFLKKAKATHTPVIIVSGTPRDVVLKQLEYAGLLKYISRENVIGGSEESRGYYNRARVIRKIQVKHPGYTIAHWDDSWGMSGIDKTNEPGVICCGTPQGQPYSKEFDYNREELIRAGADYIFHGWRSWNDVVNFFVLPEVQKDYDDIVISDEFRHELTEYTYPDLVTEGYRVVLNEETYEAVGIPCKIADVFGYSGRRYSGHSSFFVIDKYKIIVIEEYSPNFPNERRGRGRALLRQLLSGPEYAGYKIISNASDSFRKSFSRMVEFNPLVRQETDNSIFINALKGILEEITRGKPQGDTEYDKLLKTFLTKHLVKATLYGVVPQKEDQLGVDTKGPRLANAKSKDYMEGIEELLKGQAYEEGIEHFFSLVKKLGLDTYEPDVDTREIRIRSMADELETAVSELTMNRVYIGHKALLKIFSRLVVTTESIPGIDIIVVDDGVGIENIQDAVEITRANTDSSYPENGPPFVEGGLAFVKRVAITSATGYFEVESKNRFCRWAPGQIDPEIKESNLLKGTKVRIVKFFPRLQRADNDNSIIWPGAVRLSVSITPKVPADYARKTKDTVEAIDSAA